MASDLVDHHHDHESPPDILQQALKGGPLHRPAGKASIIISGLDEPPALTRLALDERLTRLALSVQRVEILFKAFFGRLPRIDCAASCSRFSVLHRGSPHAIALGRRTTAPTIEFP